MKREVPIALAFVVGALLTFSFFFTSKPLTQASATVEKWRVSVAAFALGLASANLIQIHVRGIMRNKGQDLDWLYSDALFVPGQSTVYAMTGFFVASAAYMAFRVRNVEAAILLGSAAILMLANVPVGQMISGKLPAMGQWLTDIPNLAGQRGTMIGAGIGGIASGLRVLLGIQKSYFGGSSQ